MGSRRSHARPYTRKHPRDKKDSEHHKEKKHHSAQQGQDGGHRNTSESQQDQTARSQQISQSPQPAPAPQLVQAFVPSRLPIMPGTINQPSQLGQSNQPDQPNQSSQSDQSTSRQLPTTQGANLQPPTAAASRAPVSSTATAPTVEGSKPSIAMIAGATAGGVVLLLVLFTVIACKCSNRKKTAAKEYPDATSKDGIKNGMSSVRTADLMMKHTDYAYPSSSVGSHVRTQGYPHLQSNHSKAGSGEDHVSLAIPQERSTGFQLTRGDLRGLDSIAQPIEYGSQQNTLELNQPGVQHGGESENDHLPVHSYRASLGDGEKTFEGDDGQIDRCLSYYMKRHTRASVHPDVLPGLRSPLPRDSIPDLPSPLPRHLHMAGGSPTTPEAQDRPDRRSFKFPKTTNLLERIRRSQIRLNNEALSKARKEGYCVSGPVSHKARTSVQEASSFNSSPISVGTDASKYDASSSYVSMTRGDPASRKIPAHWRSSSKVQRQLAEASGAADPDVLGTSPAVSEPHSAFEYADYYDSYLPGPHTSLRLPLTSEDVGDGFAVPWQDHSPCRSSALSPRQSTNMSMRQRSATFGLASPSAWPSDATAETSADAAQLRRSKSHLSTVPDIHRESAEVDEVIRF
ncbi:uncharacterized protein UTRI_02823_B [Ustilago trichophora]|uniref:Uncharacterized protein n=1 Tax=Ustilago trichophora TaxID=86804 RepID=A0A5C3E760_9BASI|nr:uncharacterized protein UTRI_02823_B [Ustilago trichophora]